MNEECLICKAPLKYTENGVFMECAICHKKEETKTFCENGHYVCNECHINGVDRIISVCMNETDKNPIKIYNKIVNMNFCHMHGPEHHIIVGSALLTAYKNSGGNIDLYKCLSEMQQRGKKIPGGVCGFWGACGAAISSGIFISVISDSTPLTEKPFGLANMMTSKALCSIGKIGGPRCCKRNSYIALLNAIDFVRDNFGIEMEKEIPCCAFSDKNNQCLGEKCPFSKKKTGA